MKAFSPAEIEIMTALEANRESISRLKKSNAALLALLPKRKRPRKKRIIKDPVQKGE